MDVQGNTEGRRLRKDLKKTVVNALFGCFGGDLEKRMDVDPGGILRHLRGV